MIDPETSAASDTVIGSIVSGAVACAASGFERVMCRERGEVARSTSDCNRLTGGMVRMSVGPRVVCRYREHGPYHSLQSEHTNPSSECQRARTRSPQTPQGPPSSDHR